MILPPEAISTNIEDGVLGRLIVDCLESFQASGGPLSAQEWELLNQELLVFFDERSVAAF